MCKIGVDCRVRGYMKILLGCKLGEFGASGDRA